MRYQAHRGDSVGFPENTMAAYQAAALQGYGVIELDPGFTKDGKCVVLHDATLNRTCRINGKELEGEVRLADLDFHETQQYDAGVWKSPRFAGEKIPLLEDVLAFAVEKGITIKLDNRIEGFTREQTASLFEVIHRSGARVAFTCKSLDYIKKAAGEFPDAEIHYDGYVDEAALREIAQALAGRPFTVWLGLPSEAIRWNSLPKADAELCAAVKRYAALGIWILSTQQQLSAALELGADIIETNGELKP